MKEFDIEERALNFGCRVLDAESRLRRNPNLRKQDLDQMANAATSIGANLEEARGAHSRADFHHKVRISLKEARETKYWLRLVAKRSKLPGEQFDAIIKEASEIVAILTTIAKKTNPKP